VRAPFQILVIPYRRTASGTEFGILKRSDADYWQFVAGGGENEETPVQAAERETKEEIGVEATGHLLRLDSIATIPKNNFSDSELWGPDIYVILEHAFAIEVGNRLITLSREHTEYRWVSYIDAYNLLKWDSNRNALWELNDRLK
jgi:dihydroneopterin triphosphate diphosphatase